MASRRALLESTSELNHRFGLLIDAMKEVRDAALRVVEDAEESDLPPLFVGSITTNAVEFVHLQIEVGGALYAIPLNGGSPARALLQLVDTLVREPEGAVA